VKILPVLLILVFSVSACAPKNIALIDTGPLGAEHDEMYPHSIELCAISQIRPIHDEKGGSYGHALMYLNGVCIKENSPYPQLKMCEPEDIELLDADAGVGISVNKLFKNINWIAIPGKQLFLSR